MLPRSRRALKNALLVSGYVCLSLTALLGVTLGIAALASWFDELPIATGPNFFVGLIAGLVVVMILFRFHLRKTTVQLRISDRDQFLRRMRQILQDLGHEWVHMTGILWRTRPGFRSWVVGDGITMVLD